MPTPKVYAATILGGVQTAGSQLLDCAARAGFGTGSHVHAVRDGAAWIVGQVEERFGEQGSYLIDFYHVCECSSAVAEGIAPEADARESRMEAQKEALKSQLLDQTLAALARHVEASEVEDDDDAPARQRHRYLSTRRKQLKYRDALAKGLPIGSEEIERARRYIAQERSKLPLSSWTLVDRRPGR